MMLTAAQVATLLGLSESRHFGRNLPHTYVDDAVQLAWELWQDVADGSVTIEPDAMT